MISVPVVKLEVKVVGAAGVVGVVGVDVVVVSLLLRPMKQPINQNHQNALHF